MIHRAGLSGIILVLAVVLIVLKSCRCSQFGDQLNSTNCVCPGDQLTRECTSIGGVATIWNGSAFDCGSEQSGQNLPDEIRLRHSRFNSSVERQCGNNERIKAQTVGVVNNTYFTSLLNMTVSSDMNYNGTVTIQCDTENADGSRVTIDMVTVMVATRFIQFNGVHLANVSRNLLTFKWSSDTLYCSTSSYEYIIHAVNCGVCPSKTNTTKALCNASSLNFASGGSGVCNFTVQIQTCGDQESLSLISDTESTAVMLVVPDPPELLQLLLQALDETGKLLNTSISLMVNENLAFNISEGIDGSPISYTITFSDSVCNTTCFQVTIPASQCEKGVCNFSQTVISECCIQSSEITATVFASNVLGDGPMSDPITIANHSIQVPTIESKCNKDCDTDNGKKSNSSATTVIVAVLLCAVFIILFVMATVVVIFAQKKLLVFTKLHCECIHHCSCMSREKSKSKSPIKESNPSFGHAEGCVYAKLSRTTGGQSTLHEPRRDNKVEYAQLHSSESKRDCEEEPIAVASNEVATTLECVPSDNNTTPSSVHVKEQDPIWENCILYAELNHSSVSKKSTSAQTALRKFTVDDAVLYSDIKCSITNNATISTSTNSAEHVLDSAPQQLNPRTVTEIDDEMNLDMLLIQLRPQAASKWYSLGLALGAEKESMDKYAHHPDEACLVEILDSWLRNHKGKPTWKEIAKAVEEIGLQELATDLLHSYETGHLPIEVDMDTVPDID